MYLLKSLLALLIVTFPLGAGIQTNKPAKLEYRLPSYRSLTSKDVKNLLAQKTLDVTNEQGETAAMILARDGNLKLLTLLIDNQANLKALDNNSRSALIHACRCSDETKAKQIVAYLLSKNADPNIMDKQENTCLMHAAKSNHAEVIKLLVAAGALLEAKGFHGNTALSIAARGGHDKALQALIDLGASKEARNSFSMTPLMEAAFNNQGSSIRLLLNAGANPDSKTTKDVKVKMDNGNRLELFPEIKIIPTGSTALDIARKFEKYFAEHILLNP